MKKLLTVSILALLTATQYVDAAAAAGGAGAGAGAAATATDSLPSTISISKKVFEGATDTVLRGGDYTVVQEIGGRRYNLFLGRRNYLGAETNAKKILELLPDEIKLQKWVSGSSTGYNWPDSINPESGQYHYPTSWVARIIGDRLEYVTMEKHRSEAGSPGLLTRPYTTVSVQAFPAK